MSPEQELRQAIQLMREGAVSAAAPMLNRLAESGQLDNPGRAAAYVWLAESREDRDFKIRCLERALEADPANAQIRQGLQQLLSPAGRPDHLPELGESAIQTLEQAPKVAGIAGGANGVASAVFASQDGLLATTSYAVGGAEAVSVDLGGEGALSGSVVRRDPLQDIALIEAPVRLARKPAPAPPTPTIEQMPFLALSQDGTRLRGRLMARRQAGTATWLATNLPPVQMGDAGGSPIFDDREQLLGILTLNTDPAGFVYAIPIQQISELAAAYKRDRQLLPQAAYCRACGGLARAPIYGGRYCEHCGAPIKLSQGKAPHPDQLRQIYGESQTRPCPHCGAAVGHYRGRCLRCGYAQAQRSRMGNGAPA